MNGFWLFPAGVLFILLPFALAGLWAWFGVMAVLGAIVCFAEVIAIKTKGLTLSGMFWKWKSKNKKMAWIIVIGLVLFTLALAYHLIKEV